MTEGRTPADELDYARTTARKAGGHAPDCKVYTVASCTCGLWARQDLGLNGAGVDAELAAPLVFSATAGSIPDDAERTVTVGSGGGSLSMINAITSIQAGPYKSPQDVLKTLEIINEGVRSHLPAGAQERKAIPLATGFLDYFPDAIVAVAALSKIAMEQHNPGKPLFWDRTKSTDEADTLIRHFLDRGTYDTDGVRHSVKVAWRALALLQKELEAARADLG